MKDWEDGPDEYDDALPSALEMVAVEVQRWEEVASAAGAMPDGEVISLKASAFLQHLRWLQEEYRKQPATAASREATTVAASDTEAPAVALPPPSDVMSRNPTPAELVYGGALQAFEQQGRHFTFQHRHHPLKDGRFDAEVNVIEWADSSVRVTPIYPGPTREPFQTAEEARAYNVAMARSFITDVSASSPSRPTGYTQHG